MVAPSFRPARPRRAFEEILEQIRGKLRNGELRPGDRLPTERDMADQFAVGRNTVREALRMLEITGLIELRRGAAGGAFIAQADPARFATSMSDMLELSGFTLADITEARRWVEAVVVRVACERADDELIARLEANVAEASRLAESGQFELRATVNIEFHTILAEATGNPVMIALMHSLLGAMLSLILNVGSPMDAATVLASRRRFLDALRRRDAVTAVTEMDDHLDRIWAFGEQLSRDGDPGD
jgi:GntR family transcriptional repressor for pyruvate dehydrogenase complex